MSPYSMPLWTIFVKWPAPAGPACTKPPSGGARAVNDRLRRRPRPPGAADHQAVALLEPPHARRTRRRRRSRSPARRSYGLAPAISRVVGVAAVDHDVAGAEQAWSSSRASLGDRARTAASPRRLGGRRASATRSARVVDGPAAVGHERLDEPARRGRMPTTSWPRLDEPLGHVATHAAEADHPELHVHLTERLRWPSRGGRPVRSQERGQTVVVEAHPDDTASGGPEGLQVAEGLPGDEGAEVVAEARDLEVGRRRRRRRPGRPR